MMGPPLTGLQPQVVQGGQFVGMYPPMQNSQMRAMYPPQMFGGHMVGMGQQPMQGGQLTGYGYGPEPGAQFYDPMRPTYPYYTPNALGQRTYGLSVQDNNTYANEASSYQMPTSSSYLQNSNKPSKPEDKLFGDLCRYRRSCLVVSDDDKVRPHHNATCFHEERIVNLINACPTPLCICIDIDSCRATNELMSMQMVVAAVTSTPKIVATSPLTRLADYSLDLKLRLSELLPFPSLLYDTYHHEVLQGNFAPVDEVGEALQLSVTDGEIPDDFPQGIYLRTGD
ncbi:hypothetical protein GW17_00035032 [Ensete ventricosum]|nr:hypothetical protein GW17_00035032 [Ensete ventricosum]